MSNNFNLDFDKIKYIKNIYKFTKSEEKYLNDNYFTIQKYIRDGEIQPAYVFNIDPLVISAYNDTIDNVILLEFPNDFVDKYNLKLGDRLLTSNVYWPKPKTKYGDILPGVSNNMMFSDVYPFLLKFLVKDDDITGEEFVKENKFSEFIWNYIENLTYAYYKFSKGTHRDGFFYMFKGDKRG